MENKYVVVRSGLSLTTLGIITGIVLCILNGVGVIHISWFWATFPFWIVPAAGLALLILVGAIACIVFIITLKADE